MLKIKSNKIKIKTIEARNVLLLALASIVIIFGLFLYSLNHESSHRRASSYDTNVSASDEYRNLDLSIASKAIYQNTSISIARDLGTKSGVRYKIAHFNVPKDHLVESALLALPTTPKPAKGYPVIVLCHGYVNPLYYSTEKAYLPDVQFYASKGFAVLKPDFRGQGLSLTQGSPDGAYYSMAYNTDVLSLIAAVKQTQYLDKSKINLWGHSMGAYIALRASVLSKDVKNTILLSGPVGYIQDMFTAYIAISDTNNATAGNIRAQQLSLHGTPLSNPSYWNNVSPLNFLKNSKSFYQIHVGTADKIVPPRFSADLDGELTKDNIPHQYFVYSGADHGLMSLRENYIWPRSLAQLQK